MEFLESLEYWHWGILGALFLVLEMFVAGAFFLFTGLAAIVILVIMLIIPVSWPVQFIVWGVVSVILMSIWKLWRKKNPAPNHDSTLNKRGHQYVGRNFTLNEPVINGFGKIKVDDSIWKVECDNDYSAGTKINITDVDGVLLKAKKAE